MTDLPLRWSVERRIAFAAARLYWDGSLNREDLIRRFGVSPNQASADVARLKAAHPETILYDTVAKSYVRRADYVPPEADPAQLLTELRLIAEAQLPPEESTLRRPPDLGMADAPSRAVPREVLRVVLAAIGQPTAFEAAYVSFQRPEVTRRTLSPHALVFDGFRWHVRAHDAEDGAFKDFVLARLSEPSLLYDPRARAADDTAWSTRVAIVIEPHPGLTPHQRAVICSDYGMDDSGRLTLTVREAVRYYTLKRLGLVEGHRERPAHEQHIVLADGS